MTPKGRLNVWERLLALVQEQAVQLGVTILDGSNIRGRQKAAGAAKKAALQRNETIVRCLAEVLKGSSGVAIGIAPQVALLAAMTPRLA